MATADVEHGGRILAGDAPTAAPRPPRDEALDLLRGLAMVVLLVNHTRLDSVLTLVTGAVLSAAEVLVAVSGVAVGMVFGRRWIADAPATTVALLHRARELYLASVAVVALVWLLRHVPGVRTEAVTVMSGSAPALDAYALDGPWATTLGLVTLQAGPWQTAILAFFVAAIAVTPAILWTLARGWWLPLTVLSWTLYAAGRGWQLDVLPSLSERPFPLLVWQVLFVHGAILGWYRQSLASRLRRARGPVAATVVAVALGVAALRLGAPVITGPAGWESWHADHFSKRWLDPLRILAMAAVTAALYVALRRHACVARRRLGPLLLPLGRHSLYVFVMHVFLCLALASVPVLARGDGLGLVGNALVQAGCVALLCTMARRRFLFRWVPS